jgi:hypothetical protein
MFPLRAFNNRIVALIFMACVAVLGCTLQPPTPSPTVTVQIGGQELPAENLPPCAGLSEQACYSCPLAVGLSAEKRVTSLRMVYTGETLTFDANSTARVLVASAIGAMSATPEQRETLWLATEQVDLSGVESVLLKTPDLASALENQEIRAQLMDQVILATPPVMSAFTILKSFAGVATLTDGLFELDRQGNVIPTTGIDGLSFAPAFLIDPQNLQIQVSADESVYEIRSILVGNVKQAYIKGPDALDPLKSLTSPDRARDEVVLSLPVSAAIPGSAIPGFPAPEHPVVGIAVVAPSLTDLAPPYTSVGLAESFEVDKRSLAGYSFQTLAFLISDMVPDLVSQNCQQAIFSALEPAAFSAAQSVEAGRGIFSALKELIKSVLVDSGPDIFAKCVPSGTGFFGRLSEFVGFIDDVLDKLKVREAAEQISFVEDMLSSFGGGPGLTIYLFDLCSVCPGECSVSNGSLSCDSAQQPSCGDGSCNGTESCSTCSQDCGTCAPSCGDSFCNGNETCSSCSNDCGACSPSCGDGSCNGTETCSSCSNDCGACQPVCGDNSCNGNESCSSCSNDCGSCAPSCGDGFCNGTETCSNCSQDCGACAPSCGDGSCNGNESCSSCSNDCGACAPSCGDGSCNGTETCSSCSNDCGACLPDLTISFSSPPPPTTVGLGTASFIKVTVTKTGGSLTNGTFALIRIYLSTDTNITDSDYRCSMDGTASENSGERFSNTSLNSSGSVTQTVLCAPGDVALTPTQGTLATGTYHWGAIVDPTFFHTESNDGNNVILGGTVTVQ